MTKTTAKSINIDVTIFNAAGDAADVTTTHLGAASMFAAADDVMTAYADHYHVPVENVCINRVGDLDHVAVIVAHVLDNQGHPTLDGMTAAAARRAMRVLAEAEADSTDALRAYDLLHALATHGRVF